MASPKLSCTVQVTQKLTNEVDCERKIESLNLNSYTYNISKIKEQEKYFFSSKTNSFYSASKNKIKSAELLKKENLCLLSLVWCSTEELGIWRKRERYRSAPPNFLRLSIRKTKIWKHSQILLKTISARKENCYTFSYARSLRLPKPLSFFFFFSYS